MSPCSPNDVSFDIPKKPSGPSIPGFGTPFALKLPNINILPDGFPEDLLDLLDKLQMLIPSGALKAPLNPNFGKDIFDSIMKLLDQFMPYLMMYKFFLPVLKLIICIIEVLCAIKNPFKLIRALKRLFRNCLPDFLNLFPIFAIIIMIISLLLLLLALIEYIINKIISLIKLILRNIIALYQAIDNADDTSVLAIAKKLGSLLCIFQNLFVLLSIINIIIDIFRDILSLVFAIPPCSDSDPTDTDGCCTPDVCPSIVKSQYTRLTGKIQYFNQLSMQTTVPLPFGTNPYLSVDIRQESWQIYDLDQEILLQAFINISDAADVPQVNSEGQIINTPKPVFFPTDVNYTPTTSYQQAAYTVDLRVLYNPANWRRTLPTDGVQRYVRFKNCIVLHTPTRDLINYDGSKTTINNGVMSIAGGTGWEDDGTTILKAYDMDGTTQIPGVQAMLGTFLHQAQAFPITTITSPDGYLFNDIEYTFKPNREVLLGKALITSGCIPDLAEARLYVEQVIAGDVGIKAEQARNAIQVSNGFPDPNAAQECLMAAVSALRSNFTVLGVAEFQSTTLTCLQKLKDDTNKALGTMVGLGFDPCKSSYSVEPKMQFTSKPIKVAVDIKERNGYPITSNLSKEVSADIASRLKSHKTFGNVTNFVYDGYQSYIAEITSKVPGKGTIMVSFDDNIFCINDMPSDIDLPATHTLQEIEYQFIYSPAGTGSVGTGSTSTSTSEGDSTGQPRRDEGDMAREGDGK